MMSDDKPPFTTELNITCEAVNAQAISEAIKKLDIFSSAFSREEKHPAKLTIEANAEPFLKAVRSLEGLLESRPDALDRLLDGCDSLSELIRVDLDGVSAAGTNKLRVVFQPSDRFRDFLAAI
jgi:hypothetical protein